MTDERSIEKAVEHAPVTVDTREIREFSHLGQTQWITFRIDNGDGGHLTVETALGATRTCGSGFCHDSEVSPWVISCVAEAERVRASLEALRERRHPFREEICGCVLSADDLVVLGAELAAWEHLRRHGMTAERIAAALEDMG